MSSKEWEVLIIKPKRKKRERKHCTESRLWENVFAWMVVQLAHKSLCQKHLDKSL
jgi:hypothetical protein